MSTGFIALSLLVDYVFCLLFILGIDQKLDLIAGDFSLSVLADFARSAVYAIIVFCCLRLWTFAVGMRGILDSWIEAGRQNFKPLMDHLIVGVPSIDSVLSLYCNFLLKQVPRSLNILP